MREIIKNIQFNKGDVIPPPQWFEVWFDSPYYHLLYQQRNEREARHFLDALHGHFHFQTDHKVLDLACGKGRHARYLRSLGPEVTGIDLSVSSIAEAKQFEAPGLSFQVQDMRKPFGMECYDFMLNLFTSFGYFEAENDNVQVIKNMAQALRSQGKVVLDYLNPYFMLKHLEPFELRGCDGVIFEIRREINKGHVIKTIVVIDQGDYHRYQEKVRLLFPEDFEAYFQTAGLRLVSIYGDYNLKLFEKFSSSRLILVGEKLY